MSEDVKSLEPPDSTTEHVSPSEIEALELLRRSPHPYHRRQADLRATQRSSEYSSSDCTHRAPRPGESHTILDEDGRDRRKLAGTPSDSGTEADDEGYGFVPALPAPPIKPRKGLRDIRGSGYGGNSPLLTPSQVDEEGRRLSAGYFKPVKEGSDGPSPTAEDERTARQKYLKRRRAELVRRTTEVALLGVIGLLVIYGCACWQKIMQWHRVELVSHLLIVPILLCIYPVRLLRYSKKRDSYPNRRLRQRIRIPAAFDPATILYPIYIPILISLSLLPMFPKLILPNVILSLSALPTRIIPWSNLKIGYSTIHWFISILPLIASQNTEWPSKLHPTKPYMLKFPPPEGLDPEILVSLFALHQALLPPLHYLTTTSLLTAELHLLSIALINVLLFAESPQMLILAILIWFGGLGLFVLCGHVLKWGVALARIPRWRLRRAGQIIKARQSFLQILNQGLKSRSKKDVSDSDADEDDPRINKGRQRNGSLKLNILDSAMNSFRLQKPSEPRSAVEQSHTDHFPHHDSDQASKLSPRKRRYTLPNLTEPRTLSSHSSAGRHRRSKSSVAQSFLSMTPDQAAVRKWLYASYVYFIIITLILGPVRYMIQEYALHGIEPFGWAIGYLFGNIQPLRFWVVNWNLEEWITLPPMYDPDDITPGNLGIVEYWRQSVIGAANTRLLLCLYCLGVIATGLLVVFRLSSVVEVDTRRKVFHGMMVAMLLPTIYIDPAFVSLALALVLAIFLLLDLLRASQLPPLSRPLANFLTPYVDGRDLRGPVVISHIFLLIGCAIPLWLSLAGTPRTGERPWEGWEVASRDVSMVAGVVCVGMGDAAASLIGRRFGRRKWPWAGGKSLEGSLAFALAVTIGLVFGKAWLRVGQWEGNNDSARDGWALVIIKAAVSACGASLNEAVLTGGNDNVIVPVCLWLLVRGVRL